jgi:hypothetical protein
MRRMPPVLQGAHFVQRFPDAPLENHPKGELTVRAVPGGDGLQRLHPGFRRRPLAKYGLLAPETRDRLLQTQSLQLHQEEAGLRVLRK